ncbi:MAG TPA: MFS transporter [Steroidobacteraceae bacterium]|jgi:SHS family lactate transporter-like MFS transporter|nr:MFS transporter [Steroidobacteraceae bacterium]
MASGAGWSRTQRDVVGAAFLGWTLDAFDYFLVVFVLNSLPQEFGASDREVSEALFWTLAMRPVGALLFGRLADHFGRRPALMLSVVLYSATELGTAGVHSLFGFLLLRALFGVGMGGVWGVGASLAFESVPASKRGFVSGLLQAGYPTGYLLASVAYWLLIDHIGWRGMFVLGAAPALLVLFIRSRVPESSAWESTRATHGARNLWTALSGHWRLAIYAILLMACFNFFSHGTQDLYPKFLQKQREFGKDTVSFIAIVYNIGAICGGLTFGTLSNRIGRRYAIALAAILSLLTLPFWAYASTPLLLAATSFVMQFLVQGAWGVVPAHLNELAPAALRATFPGVVYQLGNLIASRNSVLQTAIAERHGTVLHPDYAYALTWVAGVVAILLALMALFGPERRDIRFDDAAVRETS